jgi:hypothetical protein
MLPECKLDAQRSENFHAAGKVELLRPKRPKEARRRTRLMMMMIDNVVLRNSSD